MQENISNQFYSYSIHEESASKNFYVWATSHTRLCQEYVNEIDAHLRRELDQKINASLLQGKILLDAVQEQITPCKPLIPASGINRFHQPKEFMNPKEIFNKNINNNYRAELGTSCAAKVVPLPSRTYLKKKTVAQ